MSHTDHGVPTIVVVAYDSDLIRDGEQLEREIFTISVVWEEHTI
jgi:hypothetical protein